MKKNRMIVDKWGVKSWYKNDKLHREDGPARIWENGAECWYRDGKIHREDGPARTWGDGTKEWWINDNLHREDGPAKIWPNGEKEWWLNYYFLSKEAWWESISDEMKVKALFNGEGV
jgi:hypothetical protein